MSFSSQAIIDNSLITLRFDYWSFVKALVVNFYSWYDDSENEERASKVYKC